nr:MAG TPA: hypothetical protein [Caudoviricetes sp.]
MSSTLIIRRYALEDVFFKRGVRFPSLACGYGASPYVRLTTN